ncbi:hypothetical protein [Armatimonas sp.]|uniref:hypothetical protein n=1 Tax=Armatimonas sp. TaxID=1872638 RepID=UPI00286CF773|nr:hypothetical protein [Armatimonas sp.]
MATTNLTPSTKAKRKPNPYLATVGKYANEPLWDALQEEMKKQREASNALTDIPTPLPTVEKAA